MTMFKSQNYASELKTVSYVMINGLD